MKISVITINYNDGAGLRKTVESVVCQTYPDIEFIVIDGGSKDDSTEVIREYQQHMAFWVSEPDQGIYNAMNKGISRATGEYCIFMNSGDSFRNEHTVEDAFKQAKGADLICGSIVMGNGQTVTPHQAITLDTIFEHAICHQSSFIRTSLMKKYGYDESLKIVADRKFFVQALILENCSYEAIPVDIADYDITGFSAQNRTVSRLEYAKVLEELIPERIRLDYGTIKQGALYGDSPYEKLFAEIGLREYRKPVYLIASLLLRFIAIFKKSASFIRNFPVKL